MTKATKAISQQIKELRISNGLSQAALAESAGIDRKTINRIERNHFSPSLDTLFRICVALNVQPNTHSSKESKYESPNNSNAKLRKRACR